MSSSDLAVIFGAAGGIGRAAVRVFLERGCKVIAIDSEPYPDLPHSVNFFQCHVDTADHEVFERIRASISGPVDHVAICIGGASETEVGLGVDVLNLASGQEVLEASLRSNVVEVVAITQGVMRLMSEMDLPQ
jgi:NAD(P)-dependent dehydrogenase (short-subunit alcohol dehydrogenase family)